MDFNLFWVSDITYLNFYLDTCTAMGYVHAVVNTYTMEFSVPWASDVFKNIWTFVCDYERGKLP